MQDIDKIKSIVEALLIVSEAGLSAQQLSEAIDGVDEKDIREAVTLLRADFDVPARAYNIAEIAGRFRIVTKPAFLPWISNLYKKEAERLTGPSLETLAIIAYRQPITRTEIEAVRGVNCGGVVKTLFEKELVDVRGRKDTVGKPLLYGTTEKFLEIFGMKSLDDLPVLREFSEEDLDYGKTNEQDIITEIEEKVEVVEIDGDQTKQDEASQPEESPSSEGGNTASEGAEGPGQQDAPDPQETGSDDARPREEEDYSALQDVLNAGSKESEEDGPEKID